MTHKISIEVTESEWLNAGQDVRKRILELMTEQGYAHGMLGLLEEQNRTYSQEEIFNQFYKEEEE